jgi:plastocyanin
MKKVGVMIFVLILLAAGSYYFFLNYPATTYAILGLNYSGNLNQTNNPIVSNLTSTNTSTLTDVNTSIKPITPVVTESSTNSSNFNVAIINFELSPVIVTIHQGDTVFWINQENILQHLVSDKGNEIDSSLLSQGQSYSHTFANKGTFNYYSSVHPSLNGSVIVE